MDNSIVFAPASNPNTHVLSSETYVQLKFGPSSQFMAHAEGSQPTGVTTDLGFLCF